MERCPWADDLLASGRGFFLDDTSKAQNDRVLWGWEESQIKPTG